MLRLLHGGQGDFTECFANNPSVMKLSLDQIKPFAVALFARLRHPNRRTVGWALAAVPLLFFLYVLVLIPFTPAISDIRKAKSEQPTRVLTADGKELAEFKRSNREWVALDDISPNVLAALIATEDHRFYQHHGIDWLRTASAMRSTFSGDRQGGSTLTQQLARNLYPDEIGRAPTITRKLKEAITALKIELVYSKREILETYLNTVPFLYNAFGIEMAARTYFDTSAGALDLLQSATLVGMLKGNSYYNPVLNPERAQQRRNTVLSQMVKRGSLQAAKFESLKEQPLLIEFERQLEPQGPAPHFAQQLRKWLVDWADRNDYNIYTDGLVVRTTIDSRLQAMANQAVARQANQLQAIADGVWGKNASWGGNKAVVRAFIRESAEYKSALATGLNSEEAVKQLLARPDFMRELRLKKGLVQAGFLALDPSNGQVKAWVGSRDFREDAFDHVQQARRQPGSTFKPFVYGAAFRKGASPDDKLVDQIVEIPLRGGEIWRPSDGKPPSEQEMTLRDGLAYSKNTITAQLVQRVGPLQVADLARAMGVRHSKLEAVPSLALGTSPVTLKEMVAAYGTMANGGSFIEPVWVTRIEDSHGQVLQEFPPVRPEAVISPRLAYTLVDVLRGVVDRGTGSAIRSRFGSRADVAGKTGTTQDNTDGWFILMHPQLVAGAWVGFNDNRITLNDHWGQGARSALPMVGDFFQKSLRTRVIDSRVRFVEPPETGVWAFLKRKFSEWYDYFVKLFEKKALPPAPAVQPPGSESADEAVPVEATAPAEPLSPVEIMSPPQEGVLPDEFESGEFAPPTVPREALP